jgi:hypothetical protein
MLLINLGTTSTGADVVLKLERDEMRLVAARDGPHFSHARMHLSGPLDLAFSDSVRPYFYFAWGCFAILGPAQRCTARGTRGCQCLAPWRSDSTSSHHALIARDGSRRRGDRTKTATSGLEQNLLFARKCPPLGQSRTSSGESL